MCGIVGYVGSAAPSGRPLEVAIEGLRRLEIPEDMQKKYGFKPLGPADGPLKTAIFGGNSARLYNLNQQHAEQVTGDRFAQLKADYRANGGGRSNLRYGYVAPPA